MDQYIHTLIDHHILYGNSYTFKKKFIPAHSHLNLMNQYIHTLFDQNIHILYGNSYTFKKNSYRHIQI